MGGMSDVQSLASLLTSSAHCLTPARCQKRTFGRLLDLRAAGAAEM